MTVPVLNELITRLNTAVHVTKEVTDCRVQEEMFDDRCLL